MKSALYLIHSEPQAPKRHSLSNVETKADDYIAPNDTPINNVRIVDLESLHPGQLKLGFAAAQAKLEAWCKQAFQHRLSFYHFSKENLQSQILEKELPVFIDDHGIMRLGDGHHKLWALRTVASTHDLNFKIRVIVMGDFRGCTESEYQQRLHKLFPICGIDESQRLQHVAPSFSDMVDSPLRSIVGLSLKRLKISSRWLLPMSQFALGNHMLRNNLIEDVESLKTSLPKDGSAGLVSLNLLNWIETVSKAMAREGSLKDLIINLAQNEETRLQVAKALEHHAPPRAIKPTQDSQRRFKTVDTLISHPVPSI